MNFPQPHRLQGSTRWRLSEILAFEAAQTGEPVPKIEKEDDRFLQDTQVAKRFGVARGTVWRWAREVTR